MRAPRAPLFCVVRWLVMFAVLAFGISEARAESPTEGQLVDGGVLPFVVGPLARAPVLDPDLLERWDTPSVIATTAGVGLGAAMLPTRDGSASYHVKGLAESAVMSTTLTGVFDALSGKRTTGTSGVFAVGTYGALYLHGHVLARARPAWQIAAYTAIGLGTIAIAGERVVHDGRGCTDL